MPQEAQRGSASPTSLDLGFDLMSTRRYLGDAVDAAHQCQRERATDYRAFDGMRGRPRIIQHSLTQADRFIKMTFRHRGDGGHRRRTTGHRVG
jgi:hypothetical protein